MFENVRRLVMTITALALGLLLVACGGGGSSANTGDATDDLSGKLVITGSSTCAPVISQIARRFEKVHPRTRVDVQSGGSWRGINDARNGTADIGMASRALKASEGDLTPHPFARDGVCIILNKTNPVAELTDQQVIDIYTGRITNWNQVGGNDAEVTVVNKAEGRATLEVFLDHFKLKNPDIKASVVIGENEQGIKTVAGDANAIGYVSVGAAEYSARDGVAIKLLAAGGVPATTEALAGGAFPISRPLNLVTKPHVSRLAKAFIDYCLSKDVHDIIKSQYFVPLAR